MKTLLLPLAGAVAVATNAFAMNNPTVTSVPILVPPSSEDDPISFCSGCVANPVVLPPCEGSDEWQCYYYGNDGSWNFDIPCFLPTGSSGLAVSKDGLTWTKVAGREKGGSILAPSDDPDAWDSVQTGVGDVIRISSQELHMYYFGGSNEPISFGPMGAIVGFRMRIGRAKSEDNGRTWVKDDTYLLDYDPSEGHFASWPRIVTSDDEPWKMFYHAFDGTSWRAYSAESSDKGDTWTRTGLVLEGGSMEDDDYDCRGVGTRDVIRWRDGLLMIHEGVDTSSTHRLGAAFLGKGEDKWIKLNDGKPILEPGVGALGEWTTQVIGTPFIVDMPDGSLRVYHCAKQSSDHKMSIGVIESKSGDISPESWTAIEMPE